MFMMKSRRSLFFPVIAAFLLLPGIVTAQNLRVGGTVTDESNEPLVGVTVVVQGTANATITGADGSYTLSNVPTGSVLEFNVLGYEPVAATVNGTVIDITMHTDAQMVDEVVVIAYGSQKKVTLTGAVSNVGGKELLKSPTSNVGNALAGRLPGVQSVQYSGMPGADTPQIRVRGVGSLNDSSPLVLVDGVERDFMQLDPNEIADISILKDASATAVFGVRGANGVILVTTRRGEEGKASVSFSAQGGIQTVTKFIETVGSYDYATAYNRAQELDGVDPSQWRFPQTAIDHFQKGDQPILYPDTNWLKYIMKPYASQSQYNVNVSGGTERAKYFVSVGALSQGGLFKTFNTDPEATFKFNRYNFRANLDLNLSKRSQLAINIGGRIENRNEIGDGESYLFWNLQEAVPMSGSGIDDQGRRIVADPQLVGSVGDDGLERFYQLGYVKNSNNVLNLDLRYQLNMDFITPGLSFKVQGSYNSNYTAQKNRKAGYKSNQGVVKYIATNVGTDEEPIVALKRGVGQTPLSPYSEARWGGRNWYAEASFNYAREFGLHNVGALVLYNQSKSYYPGGAYNDIPTGYVGMVGRVTYDYDTRYLVDFNVGYNGSENFAPGKRYGLFPSASVGWIPSNEKWWEPLKNAIPYMKLRASVGMVGNDKKYEGGSLVRFVYVPGRYEIFTPAMNGQSNANSQNWGNATTAFGVNNSTLLPGAKEGSVGNPDVTWETATKQNYGLDLGLLRSRLTLSVDVFFEKRNDILTDNSSTLAAITGMPTTMVNFGKMENHGYEITLKWEDRKGDFWYSIAPSLTFARNKVLEMGEVPKQFDYLFRTGHPLNQPFGYEYFELYEPGATEERYREAYGTDMPDHGYVLQAGDAVYVDLSGDGQISALDEHAMGYTDIPEYNAALNLGFGWKGFDVSMLWIGVTNTNRWIDYSFGRKPFGEQNDAAMNKWVYERSWTPETADTATLPRITFTNRENNNRTSSLWMVDGSYVRLKSAEIGYTFNKIPKVPQIGSIRVYVSGYNLLTFATFTGNDPESASGAWNEFIKYPMTRVINFGANINF
jgi:TonB-linked SusC/RagA family outer membrane protein